MFKKYILTPLFLIIVIILYVIGTAIGIWNYGHYDDTIQADVAIVLGASVSYKTVSPVYRERINHAINLYSKGYVKKIILTGGKVDGQEYSDASVARTYAHSKGVPYSAILIEEKSTITRQNLLYAKEIMDQKGYQTALIVSDPLHMKRSMLMAEDIGINAHSSPTQTTMYKTRETKFDFLKDEVFVYIGYKFYRIFYLFNTAIQLLI